MRIFSSAAWCFRVARRMLRTSVSDDAGVGGFPVTSSLLEGYDEPEILRSSSHQFCLTSAEGGHLSKVPEVTLGFWIIKIAATTLGETGGDSVTMTLNWGYLIGTAIFLGLLIVLVVAQILAHKFHPVLYWATIVASTTFGTTMADFADRSLGVGYAGGSTLLLVCLAAVLGLWYWSQGTISVNTVSTPKVEAFYWAAITFSQTLGTALGDWTADTGLGYEGGALIFGAGLAVIAGLYYWTNIVGFTLNIRHSFDSSARQFRATFGSRGMVR